MQVNIKNGKILKAISRELEITPSSFIDRILQALEYAPEGFKINAKKFSVESAILDAFHQAQFANSITKEICNVLGEFDATLDDFEFNFDERSFWFYMAALVTEKKINIDSLSLWLDSDGAQLRVERILRGLTLEPAKIKATKKEANELDTDAYEEFEDLLSDELEWQFDLFSESYAATVSSQEHENKQKGEEADSDENTTTLVLTIFSEEFSSMSPLTKLDRLLDRFEKIVRGS